MRRFHGTKRWLGLVAVVALAGCVGEPEADGGEGDELDRLAHELFEVNAIANGVACGDCYDDLPPVSQAACDELALRDHRCSLDAYRLDVEASLEHITCTLPAERDYATCLEEDVVCGDAATWKECAYPLQVEQDDCAPLPADVAEALALCWDPD